MLLERFRYLAQVWRDAGIINDIQYQQLTQHYQANLETKKNRFIFIWILLASILILSGVITFVAANWQVLTREIKVALLLGLLFATNITGFHLWQQPIKALRQGRNPRPRKYIFGQALLILSALLLSINISLIGELFHINQSNYELLLLWGMSVTFMAYSLRLHILAILGLVSVLVGYLTSLSELPYLSGDISWTVIIVEHMPLLLWLVFVPLAIWCKSHWLFSLTAIVFTLSLYLNIEPLQYLSATNMPTFASFAFVLPPALLWSYDDLLFPKVSKRHFQLLARNLALVCLCVFFYILGFYRHWLIPDATLLQPNRANLMLNITTTIDVVFLSFIAVVQWLFLIQQKLSWKNLVILSLIAICGVAPFGNYFNDEFNMNIDIPGAAVVLFNALFVMFALLLMRHAVETRTRWKLWSSIFMLTLLFVTRMFEYQTNLTP
jgi:uncharacterized membrane protein